MANREDLRRIPRGPQDEEERFISEVLEELERIRKVEGFTRKEWALRAGTSRIMTSNILSQGMDVRLSTLCRLAKGLGRRAVVRFEERDPFE